MYVCVRERVRQLELVQSPESTGRNLDIQLAQELVATRVALDSAGRRVTLIESERDRLQRTLQETQVRLRHSALSLCFVCSRVHV